MLRKYVMCTSTRVASNLYRKFLSVDCQTVALDCGVRRLCSFIVRSSYSSAGILVAYFVMAYWLKVLDIC